MSISNSKEVSDDAISGAALDVRVHHVGHDPVRPAFRRIMLSEVILKNKQNSETYLRTLIVRLGFCFLLINFLILNFINVLRTAFTYVDPECAKKRLSSQQCHLALLVPTSVKAAHKTLVKLTSAALQVRAYRSEIT